MRRIGQVEGILKSGDWDEKQKLKKFSTIQAMQNQINEINAKLGIVENEVREMKKELRQLQNMNEGQRSLQMTKLKSRDIVSLFSSSLTRAIGIPTGHLTSSLIIVKTFYFKVLEDIIKDGFTLGGQEYVPFTASAGQIRTKKTVFIKKEVYQRIQPSLMCGLSPKKINNKGGVNVNKFLAYLALSNTATEVWKNFDIEKSIVVDDMETMVTGDVDFIDYNDYSINEVEMDVPVPHTDGCGMMLPKMGENKEDMKAMMVRMPWMKGLLVPFPFDKFIRENTRDIHGNLSRLVTDIYGKEHDIIKDGIEVIFTKSQFKMWRFYNSWEEYKNFYHEYNCEAGYCNEEPNIFGNAKLNYQMLQTLTDITDEELEALSSKTVHNIEQMGKDREVMLSVLGVVDHNMNKNYYQQALEIYPEMLNDTFSKQTIKATKKSMIKQARSGRLDIEAKYTFLIPDLYAVSEHLFLGIEKPKGLLEDGEVSCKLYKNGKKVDCLRSPHLYREHAVRRNRVTKEIKRWFVSNGIYTSSHDLISKMLQFDNDGDTSLVVGDSLFVEIAERNMDGIVPLYYEMKGSDPAQISRASIYTSMTNAYSGGNIGAISNNITKIWNDDEPNLDMVKLLCLENNFVIDYAKTLYKPVRPAHLDKPIKSFTSKKVPYFFMYAKDKSRRQVESKNNSTVNRLKDIIPTGDLWFYNTNVGEFDYTMLMSGKKMATGAICDEVIDKYEDLDQHKHFFMRYDDEKDNNIAFVYQEVKRELMEMPLELHQIIDVLVEYLYLNKDSSYKTTLWEVFGYEIIQNLKQNIDKPLEDGWVMCEKCGIRVKRTNNRTKFCLGCYEIEKNRRDLQRMKRTRSNQKVNK